MLACAFGLRTLLLGGASDENLLSNADFEAGGKLDEWMDVALHLDDAPGDAWFARWPSVLARQR